MPLDRYNSRTVPALVTSFLRIMNELMELMALEPEFVKNRKFAEHQELLKRKQKLALEYRAHIKSLSSQADMLKGLPDDVRKTLKTTAKKFAETAEHNATSLRAAVMAVQRLIQNIVAHIKKEVLANPNYKNPKTSYLELGNYSPTCKPVAVRRSV